MMRRSPSANSAALATNTSGMAPPLLAVLRQRSTKSRENVIPTSVLWEWLSDAGSSRNLMFDLLGCLEAEALRCLGNERALLVDGGSEFIRAGRPQQLVSDEQPVGDGGIRPNGLDVRGNLCPPLGRHALDGERADEAVKLRRRVPQFGHGGDG